MSYGLIVFSSYPQSSVATLVQSPCGALNGQVADSGTLKDGLRGNLDLPVRFMVAFQFLTFNGSFFLCNEKVSWKQIRTKSRLLELLDACEVSD